MLVCGMGRPGQAGLFLPLFQPQAPLVSDIHPGRPHGRAGKSLSADRRTLMQRLIEFLSPGPDSKDELIETLAEAEDRELIEPESRVMLEGVLRMADMTAGDVMVAAPRMDLLAISAVYEDLLDSVIGTGHSRFPGLPRAGATTSSAS